MGRIKFTPTGPSYYGRGTAQSLQEEGLGEDGTFANAPTYMTIATQPSGFVESAGVFATQPAIQVWIDLSLHYTGDPVTITASLATGTGTLGGQLTATTDTDGLATFVNLALTGSGDHTILFSATGLTGATSNTVSIGGDVTIVLAESFDSAISEGTRGWYDVVDPDIGSYTAYAGAACTRHYFTTSAGGANRIGRHAITNSDEVYISFWIRHSANYVGASPLTYHPHLMNLLSDADHALAGGYTGGADAYLNFYIEEHYASGVKLRLIVQDSRRIDNTAIGYDPGGEDVSVGGANGNRDGTGVVDYYEDGAATTGWVNAKYWDSDVILDDTEKQNWHKYEIYIRLNSVVGGVAQYDGQIWARLDGAYVLNLPSLYLRSGDSPVTGFQQFTYLPFTEYSSVNQYIYVDELEISAGAPSQLPSVETALSITRQPSSSVQSGSVLGTQPIVQVMDQYGQAYAKSGVTVTASIASGGGTLSGTLTAVTNAFGAATFTNLTITGTAGGRTLAFAATGLTGATSSTITVTASGGYATPNIVNNASFETGWDGFTTSTGGTPTGMTRSAAWAKDGSYCIRRAWNNNGGDQSASVFYDAGTITHVWARCWYRVTTAWPNGGGFKFFRFQNVGFGDLIGVQYLNEHLTMIVQLGGQISACYFSGVSGETVGVDHSLEFEIDNSTRQIRAWVDGTAVNWSEYSDTAGLTSISGTTITYSSSFVPKWLDICRVINPTTNSGAMNVDRVAISTAGRIGP